MSPSASAPEIEINVQLWTVGHGGISGGGGVGGLLLLLLLLLMFSLYVSFFIVTDFELTLTVSKDWEFMA